MFFYKFLDLPKIPESVMSTLVCKDVIREFSGRQCNNGTKQFMSSNGIFYHANAELDHWVRNNINLDIELVGVRYQYGTPDTPCHGAHTDATRDYALLYVVDNGGGSLKFWQKSDCPIEHDTVQLVNDYTDLIELQTVSTPNGVWYLVNGRVIHSVENMTSTRITVQLNLKSL